jgi:hypothetical protein
MKEMLEVYIFSPGGWFFCGRGGLNIMTDEELPWQIRICDTLEVFEEMMGKIRDEVKERRWEAIIRSFCYISDNEGLSLLLGCLKNAATFL